MNARIDWMVAPGMAEYVNSMVSGRPLNDGGHWGMHALREHVGPLAGRRGRGLSMLSLGCGNCHIEAALVENFGWPIEHLLGFEYDSALRESAQARLGKIKGVNASFEFFDFNDSQNFTKSNLKYDVVFVCHALHHANDLEGILKYINNSLVDDGLFIGIEYLGPTRFQIEYDVLPIIHDLFKLLPSELRQNLLTGVIDETFVAPTIEEVVSADVSESVRSSDLRTLLLSNFPINEIKPMGGTILRWLLQYRAGNFQHDNEYHLAIAHLLQLIEKQMIHQGRIKSDDLFFSLSKSSRFG